MTASHGPPDDSWQMLGAQLLEGSAGDLRRLAAASSDDTIDDANDEATAGEDDEERLQAMIARIEVRASSRSLERIHHRLEALLTDLSCDDDEPDPGDETQSFDLVLAFCPEPRSED